MNAAIINDINYCKYCVPAQLAVTTTIAAGPTPVSVTPIYFRRAVVLGKKAVSGTVNVGVVKLGYSSVASEQPFNIASNDEVILEAPVGAKHSLSDVYITVATNGDGVVVLYS